MHRNEFQAQIVMHAQKYWYTMYILRFFRLFKIYGINLPECYTMQIRVIISNTNPKEKLVNSRGISKQSLVFEPLSETVMLPPKFLEYTPNNIVMFLLQIQVSHFV